MHNGIAWWQPICWFILAFFPRFRHFVNVRTFCQTNQLILFQTQNFTTNELHLNKILLLAPPQWKWNEEREINEHKIIRRVIHNDIQDSCLAVHIIRKL